MLADTWEHAAFYGERFGLARERLAVVPVGAAPAPQATGSARELTADEPLVVFQYGKWSPLHGAETVLAAAELLRDGPCASSWSARGSSRRRCATRIARRGLGNVEWLGMLAPEELRAGTLAADVCLGVFGASDKARRVIPTKVHEALACGRPVVTADGAAARELLRTASTRCWCPPGDPDALAGAPSNASAMSR